MINKFEFKDDLEKEIILNNNKEKYLIEVQCLNEGNFLILSDLPTMEILQQQQSIKINTLEKETIQLKQENADLTFVLMMEGVI